MNQLAYLYPGQYRREVRDINRLLRQLSRKAIRVSEKKLLEVLKQPNFFLIDVKENGHIIAIATLIIDRTLLGDYGTVRDVVVDKNHRGQGLGEKVMRQLIHFADSRDVARLELTSRPSRKSANKLYRRLGFKRHNTNFYSLSLV